MELSSGEFKVFVIVAEVKLVIIKTIQNAQATGGRVEMSYKKYLSIPFWKTGSNYVIESIKFIQVEK